jgi:hypothetical protein
MEILPKRYDLEQLGITEIGLLLWSFRGMRMLNS